MADLADKAPRAPGAPPAEELDLLRRELAEARARADELDAFAGRVAHDLQAPARQVAALAELLPGELGGVPERAAEVLRLLVASGSRLAGLTAALLAYTRLATCDLAPVAVETSRAVAAALADLEADVAAAAADITVEHPLAPVLATDRVVRDVAFHLVQNACRHAGRGGVHVRVSARRRGGFVDLAVTDDGGGVAAEDRDQAFEPLRRLVPTGGDGFGLGLAAVRRAATRLGGGAVLEPGPGGNGTRARVWLPAAEPAT